MTDEQRAQRIHDITYSTEDRAELAERIVALEAENAKLRELVADLHLTADEFSKKYERPFYIDKFLFRRDHINDRMRELGIEVAE